jgi:hypothetical protein
MQLIREGEREAESFGKEMRGRGLRQVESAMTDVGTNRAQADRQAWPNERLQATATTEVFGDMAASRFGGRA